jgi:hypothetical protein
MAVDAGVYQITPILSYCITSTAKGPFKSLPLELLYGVSSGKMSEPNSLHKFMYSGPNSGNGASLYAG